MKIQRAGPLLRSSQIFSECVVCFMPYSKFLSLFALLLIPNISMGSNCISSPKAKARLIYLHGMDTPEKSAQEKSIREILKKIGTEQNIEVFMPRSQWPCPGNKDNLCWMWASETKNNLLLQQETLIKNSKTCFKSNAPLLWFGFSNGGNRLLQLLQACGQQKYLTIGSSGGVVTEANSSLAQCGHLYAAIGTSDKWNYEPALEFYRKLRQSGASLEIIQFSAGHEVTGEVLTKLLDIALKTEKKTD